MAVRALERIRQRVKELTPRSRCHADVREVIADLNPVLRGWGAYFRTGNAAMRFRISPGSFRGAKAAAQPGREKSGKDIETSKFQGTSGGRAALRIDIFAFCSLSEISSAEGRLSSDFVIISPLRGAIV